MAGTDDARARLAFETYRAALNAVGADIRPTWEQLPATMREVWQAVVDALCEH